MWRKELTQSALRVEKKQLKLALRYPEQRYPGRQLRWRWRATFSEVLSLKYWSIMSLRWSGDLQPRERPGLVWESLGSRSQEVREEIFQWEDIGRKSLRMELDEKRRTYGGPREKSGERVRKNKRIGLQKPEEGGFPEKGAWSVRLRKGRRGGPGRPLDWQVLGHTFVGIFLCKALWLAEWISSGFVCKNL